MKPLFFSFIAALIFSQCTSIDPNRLPQKSNENLLPQSLTSINIPIEIPFGQIERRINSELASQIWSFKELPIGNGLSLDLEAVPQGSVDLSSLSHEILGISLPVKVNGNIKFEKRVLGQVLATQLPFQEYLNPELSFSPQVNKDWNFVIKDLQIHELGNAFKYGILGFEVDLSTVIKNQFQKYLNSSLEMNQLQVLDIKSIVDNTWKALHSVSPVSSSGIEAYLYSQPENIYFTQELTSDQFLKMYLGVTGKMETIVGNQRQIITAPVPPLKENGNTSNGFEVVMPIIIQYDYLNKILNQDFGGKTFRLDEKTDMIPNQIKVQNYGDRAMLSFDFFALRKDKSDVTGKMFIVGNPVFDPKQDAVVLENISVDIHTQNPLTRIGILSKRRKMIRQIKKLAVFPLEDYLAVAKNEIQKQQNISTNFADVNVVNPSLEIIGIYPTDHDLQIFVRSLGEIDVKINGLL